jgi:anti-sigma regulatory factor (Ser/Thr protein kinase)
VHQTNFCIEQATSSESSHDCQICAQICPPDRRPISYDRRVLGDADRAGDIIDRIRDHIKKAPPRKHRFDLNEAINEVLVLARSAITRNGVSVQTFTEGLLPVQGDRVQLQQVVLNLIMNAVEAMGSSDAGRQELLISTEQSQANGVLVAVRDSGPGIDPEHLERVLTLSTPRSRAEWGWGCRSAGPSSMPMGAGSGHSRMNLEAQYFSSPCPSRKTKS